MPQDTKVLPVDPEGLGKFDRFSGELKPLLDRLRSSPSRRRGDHSSIPRKPGVYIFSLDGQAVYVGRTKNLCQRLGLHTRRGSAQNQATFAFNLAKRDAKRSGLSIKGTRKQVAADPTFKPFFDQAKASVAMMEVRFIEVDSPELCAVFEVYAALALGTGEFNNFETH